MSYVGITVSTYGNVLYSKQLQNRHIDIILTLVVATNEYDQNIGDVTLSMILLTIKDYFLGGTLLN